MNSSTPPPRPARWEEKLASRLFLALAPRLQKAGPQEAPPELRPWEEIAVQRRRGRGRLAATWYPAADTARGAVLLLHPWLPWGAAYFHRRGRIEALRAAGYGCLALSFSGFGASGPPHGFFDRDVEDALAALRERSGGLPLHVWGVSAGGYWAHPALSRTADVAGGVFEDVSAHLLEWSWRMAPWGRPFYFVFRRGTPRAYRFLDARAHAAALSLRAATYISGDRDRGVRPEDTRELARLTGGRHHIVPGADHLGSIKVAADEIVGLALETFRRAEGPPAA